MTVCCVCLSFYLSLLFRSFALLACLFEAVISSKTLIKNLEGFFVCITQNVVKNFTHKNIRKIKQVSLLYTRRCVCFPPSFPLSRFKLLPWINKVLFGYIKNLSFRLIFAVFRFFSERLNINFILRFDEVLCCFLQRKLSAGLNVGNDFSF